LGVLKQGMHYSALQCASATSVARMAAIAP
jgi:hypothetical protein